MICLVIVMTLSANFVKGSSSDDMCTDHIEICRQLATSFVDEIILKASEKAVDQLNQESNRIDRATRAFGKNPTPSIKIDEVGDRTPSPEDGLMPWMRDQVIQDNGDQEVEREKCENKSTQSEPQIEVLKMDEIHDFAKAYVNEIVAKATILASEREATFHSLHSELSQPKMQKLINSNQSWFSRLTQNIGRIMLSACLCKNNSCKHESRHSFNNA